MQTILLSQCKPYRQSDIQIRCRESGGYIRSIHNIADKCLDVESLIDGIIGSCFYSNNSNSSHRKIYIISQLTDDGIIFSDRTIEFHDEVIFWFCIASE